MAHQRFNGSEVIPFIQEARSKRMPHNEQEHKGQAIVIKFFHTLLDYLMFDPNPVFFYVYFNHRRKLTYLYQKFNFIAIF
jgi:hypothetical protein